MEGVEAELNALVLEHLRSRGLLQSSATLEKELQQRKIKTPSTVQSPSLLTKFLYAFDHGDRVTFFNLWDGHLPIQLKDGDPTSQNLEFSTSVYFAVYPLKAGTGSNAQAMQEFKAYLENRGAVLAQSQEFAMFCALPYVPDPAKHPAFKTIFTDFWTIELKTRLEQFLHQTFSVASDVPFSSNSRLLSVYILEQRSAYKQQYCWSTKCSLSHKEVAVLQKKVSDMERHYEARLMELQTNYHTLVGISMELVETLESSISGQAITSEYIHGLCSRLFGSAVLQQGIDLKRPGTSTALLRASVTALTQSVQLPRGTSTLLQPQELNYPKVKVDLMRSPGTRKALLLQAIRWWLTRSLPPKREEALKELIANDLLGCTSPSPSECTIAVLLSSTDPVVQEHAARLVNACCSTGLGRAYVTTGTHVLATLCKVLVGGMDDTHTQRNILGSIQKMSLKRPLQTLMIDAGLTKWLVEFLKGVESLSDYSMRYSLALLMNLTLTTAGKKACIPSGPTILRLLGDLLEYDDTEVRSYVNGILYSLLSVPDLRSEGRRLGLGELLSSSMKTSPPELKSQLKYILGQLDSDSVVLEDPGDDVDNEDDEEDPEVIEGDEDEAMIAESNITGETLLTNEYLVMATSSAPSVPREPSVVSPKQTHIKKIPEAPCLRPVTPLNFSNRPHTADPIACTSPDMVPRKAARSISTAK